MFIGLQKVVNEGSLKWFVSEDVEMQSGEIDENSPISQISPPLEPGDIGQYETSQGVTCYGYRARAIAQDFGYLDNVKGNAVQPTFFFCTVLAGNGPFLGSSYPHVNSGGTGLISVIIEESMLTQDMLDNPVQDLKYINSSFEVSAYICGTYGVRS